MTMSEYRDFVGVTTKEDADSYSERRAYVDTTRYSQVYAATHKGENYLPFMNRSFLSFSFGGKNIEDYNLIATIENNRLNRSGSAEFEDLVDEYNILDGQFYWGTHYKANKMTFKLATDGITEEKLNDFLYWFAGGKTRELILSEHPNRAILARASAPPALTLLPFEEPATVMVGGDTYKTKTTLYKGEITLNFVMDMPFWYSKINIFGHYNADTNTYEDTWVDKDGNSLDANKQAIPVNVFNSYENLDVMKIVLEDRIPISSMITISLLLGNNTFADSGNTTGGHIAANDRYYYFFDNSTNEHGEVIILYGSCEISIDSGSVGELVFSLIGEPIIISDDLLSLDEGAKASVIYAVNLYNSRNKIDTTLNSDSTIADIITAVQAIATNEEGIEDSATAGISLIDAESNSLLTIQDSDPNHCIFDDEHEPYEGARIDGPHMAENTGVEIFKSSEIVYFYYAGTAPSRPIIRFKLCPKFDEYYYICSPCNSYSSTIEDEDHHKIPYNTITITSLNEVKFKFTTPNFYTSYNEAIKIFHNAENKEGESWESIRSLIRDNVKHFAVRALANKIIDLYTNNNNSSLIQTSDIPFMLAMMKTLFSPNHYDEFEFNSEIGKSTAKFLYRNIENLSSITTLEEYNAAEVVYNTIEEDVSDMLKSDYIIIKDRNHPNSNGDIVAWASTTEDTRTYCHKIEHDVQDRLLNLYIEYKNMYL